MVKCPECTAITELGPRHLPHTKECSLMADHGMHGTSTTHCCYKHEFKHNMKDATTEVLQSLFKEVLPMTLTNSFEDMDRCDAIEELLQERGAPDPFKDLGIID